MNDNYINFEFIIQFLHICHDFSNNSMYTVSVYKIYLVKTSIPILVLSKRAMELEETCLELDLASIRGFECPSEFFPLKWFTEPRIYCPMYQFESLNLSD